MVLLCKALFLAASTFLLLVKASPVDHDLLLKRATTTPAMCTPALIKDTDAILSLFVSKAASSFCSKFIGQTTAHATTTVTNSYSTASTVGTTVTTTIPSGVTTTSTTTIVEDDITATTTVTTTSETDVINSVVNKMKKRATVTQADAPSGLKGIALAAASTICSCFLGASPTVTNTATASVTSTLIVSSTSVIPLTVPTSTDTVISTIISTTTVEIVPSYVTRTATRTYTLAFAGATDCSNYDGGYISGSLVIIDPLQCAAHCDNTPGCVSFENFDGVAEIASDCALFTGDYSPDGFHDCGDSDGPPGGFQYYVWNYAGQSSS